MANDAIEKVDLASAAQQLRDKIKLGFAELISDEQWDAMLQGELQKFCEGREVKDSYNGRVIRTEPSEFSVLAKQVLKEHMKEQLVERIKEKDYLPGGQQLWEMISNWLEENRQKMMLDIVSGVMSHVVNSAMINITQAVQNSLRIPDPNKPGYDINGNYIG